MSLIDKKFSEAAKVLSDADDEVLQAAGLMALMRLETLQRRLKGDNTGKKALTPLKPKTILPPQIIPSRQAKPVFGNKEATFSRFTELVPKAEQKSLFDTKTPSTTPFPFFFNFDSKSQGATFSGFTELVPKEEQKSLFDTKTPSTTPSLFPFNFGSQDKDTAKNIFFNNVTCAVKNTDLVNNEKKMSFEMTKSVDNALQLFPGTPQKIQELKTPVKTDQAANFTFGNLFGPNPINNNGTENRIRAEINVQTEPTSPKSKDNADSVLGS